MKKIFSIGFYFDLFSFRRSDWELEAEFNRNYKPDFLEVMLEVPTSAGCFDQSCVDDLQAILHPVPITVHGPTLGISLCSFTKRIVEAAQAELIDGLKVCEKFKSPLYTLHGGEFPFLLFLNDSNPAREFVKNIKPVLDYASSRDIKVCLENLKGEKIFPKNFVDLDEVFDSHQDLMLALDVRHCCINKMDVIETYERYKNRIPSIQYRDDCGLSDAQLKKFLEKLIEDQWLGNLIIEDPALNVADKKTKPMLDAGYKRVTRLLGEILN